MRFAVFACGAFAINLVLATWHAYSMTYRDSHFSIVLLLVSLWGMAMAYPGVRITLQGGPRMVTDAERAERIDAAKREVERLRQIGAPRTTFWLSFVDTDRPEGEQFLGAAIIPDCVNAVDAIGQTYQHGCNPGGAVAFAELPPIAFEEQPALKAAPTYTLMPYAELLARKLIEEPDAATHR